MNIYIVEVVYKKREEEETHFFPDIQEFAIVAPELNFLDKIPGLLKGDVADVEIRSIRRAYTNVICSFITK